jgi:hypothetical protein
LTHYFSPFFEKVVGLALADGTTWGIAAGDEEASNIVSYLTKAMQLRPHDAPLYRVLVFTNGDGAYSDGAHANPGHPLTIPWRFLPSDDEHTFTCSIPPVRNNDILVNQLLHLSLFVARQTQNKGGILLHSALVEKDGWGMILAGPGGVGKTTASRRLSLPWISLSDDETLVVRDQHGVYWAHPWPTWSELMTGGKGAWDVNHAVPLKGIFFLTQALHDSIEPLGAGYTVPLLIELAEQASWSMAHGQGRDVTRELRLQRFENICALVKTLPCFRLRLSLDGTFWEEIEQVIAGEEMGAS